MSNRDRTLTRRQSQRAHNRGLITERSLNAPNAYVFEQLPIDSFCGCNRCGQRMFIIENRRSQQSARIVRQPGQPLSRVERSRLGSRPLSGL